MGVKTESLEPPHNYVPWIVVDGQHDNEIQTAAMDNLVGLVCKLYKVVTVKLCNQTGVIDLFPRVPSQQFVMSHNT